MKVTQLLCALVVPASLAAAGGCEDFTIKVGRRGPLPPRPPVETREPDCPYGHLPQRTSFRPMSSVQLKEGCYAGDFELGRSQIRVTGAGVDKTVIHGNLVVQTQCTVSGLTVLGDVIFEGSQAELDDVDFFGRIIDKGVQNRY